MIWAHPDDHLEFTRIDDGLSPWVTLWSPVWLAIAEQTRRPDDLAIYEQRLLFHEVHDDANDWEPYAGPKRERALVDWG